MDQKLVSIVLEIIRHLKIVVALVAVLAGPLSLGGCATPPTDPAARAEFDETNDPFEPLNREIFDFNLFLTRVLLRPMAEAYRTALPEVARTGLRNFLNNLNEPVVFVNNVLQGQFQRAADTAARFALNTVVGVGGIADIATSSGFERQSGDFGQTLYSWGVKDGPYLVLPIFGPSNPRDGVGMGVDGFMDPFGYVASNYHVLLDYTISRMGADGVDQLSRNLDALDELQRDFIDFYASMRSLTRQHRASELRHGEPGPATVPGLDSLYQDPDSGTPAQATKKSGTTAAQ